MRSVKFLAGLALVAAPLVAHAQNAQIRDGFWFSGGLGYGSLGCQDCGSRTGGMSGGISAGGTISQRFLLGVGSDAWTKSDQGATLTVGTLVGIGYDYRIARNTSITPYWNGFAMRSSNTDANVGQMGIAVTLH